VYLFDLHGYYQSVRSSSDAGACFRDLSSRGHHVASYRNVGGRLNRVCPSNELMVVASGMFRGLPTKNGSMSKASCRL
jgi:hypothetical protein